MIAQVITAMPSLRALGAIVTAGAAAADLSTASYIANTVATGAWAVVTGIASAAMWVLNLALDANPVILIALAIVGLVAVLWKVTDGFKNWAPVIDAAKASLAFLWNILVDVGKEAVGFANWLGGGMADAWGMLSSGAQRAGSDVAGALRGAWSVVKSDAGAAWSWLSAGWAQLWQGVAQVAGSIWAGVVSAVRAGINFVIDIINDFINIVDLAIQGANAIISLIPGTPHIPSIPHIPHLAEGGIVTRPTIAMIGEAGAEAVMPLSSAGLRNGGGGDV